MATRGNTPPGTTQVSVSGLPNGTYFWHVQVIAANHNISQWSAPRSFTVTGQAPGTPGTPTLTGPGVGAQFHPYESVPGAASYRLEDDATDATFDFTSVTAHDGNALSYNTIYGFTGVIYYRIRAVAADGTLGLPSAAQSVTLTYNAPIPPPPSLVSPANGAQSTLPVTFDWTDDPNPQVGGYELQIAGDSAFAGDCGLIELCVRRLTPSQYTVTSLSNGTKYWRVRTWHGDASPTNAAVTAWSTVRSFNIPATPPTLVSLQLSKASTASGDNAFLYGIAGLNAAAPAGGTIVALSSSNPAALSFPASVTIPAGQATMSFDMISGQVTDPTVVTVTASLNGQSQTANITIVPPSINRFDVGNGIGSMAVLGGSSPVGFVPLNGTAPAGGAIITLSSTNPAVASMPATVTVPEGLASAGFTISTRDVTAATVVTLTATWKGQSVSTQLTVAPDVAPTIVGPAESATYVPGQLITLDANALQGASQYRIQLSSTSAFTNTLWTDTSTNHQFVLGSASLPGGRSFWRMQAIDPFGFVGPWSAARSFIVGSSGPLAAPGLVSPADSAIFAPGQAIPFDWNEVAGASQYTIQVSDSSNFTTTPIVNQAVTASAYTISTLPVKRMWWRVRAVDAAGTPGAWSAGRRFEIK